MSWIKAGVTLVGAATKYYGDKKAAAAQQKGYDAATAEQRRQFDLAREDQMPWLQAGQRALHQLEQLNSGNFSSFTASPDYQFALTEGLKGLDRSAAARGALWSGGADADRMAYASGLATQNYGNYYNRLASLAGLGQTTGNTCTIAGGKQIWQLGFQLICQLEPGGIELDLRAVEQCVVVGGARRQLVQLINHFDDIVQLPFWQGQGQIAGNRRRQGGRPVPHP